MYLLYIKTVNCSRLTNELSVLSHTVSVGSLQEASHMDDCRWINSTFVIQMFLLFSFTSDLKRCNGPNACVVNTPTQRKTSWFLAFLLMQLKFNNENMFCTNHNSMGTMHLTYWTFKHVSTGQPLPLTQGKANLVLLLL